MGRADRIERKAIRASARAEKAVRRADKARHRADQATARHRGGTTAMAHEDEAYKRARQRAEDVAGYWSHLTAYAIIITVLVVINVITWGGYFWAIWPMMGWGIGLLFHTANVFGPQRGEEWKERKAREWAARSAGQPSARWGEPGSATPRHGDAPAADPGAYSPSLAQLTAKAGEEIDRLRRVSRQIPTPEIRRQALELLASADEIAAALGDGTGDEATARTFLDRYLGPTGTILERYQRLAVRDIDAARPALRRVEEHDLPLLNRRMNELRGQIYQGDVIDLEVASEMLAFELEEPDRSGPPLAATETKPIPRSVTDPARR
jgi:hypothetical protein